MTYNEALSFLNNPNNGWAEIGSYAGQQDYAFKELLNLFDSVSKRLSQKGTQDGRLILVSINYFQPNPAVIDWIESSPFSSWRNTLWNLMMGNASADWVVRVTTYIARLQWGNGVETLEKDEKAGYDHRANQFFFKIFVRPDYEQAVSNVGNAISNAIMTSPLGGIIAALGLVISGPKPDPAIKVEWHLYATQADAALLKKGILDNLDKRYVALAALALLGAWIVTRK